MVGKGKTSAWAILKKRNAIVAPSSLLPCLLKPPGHSFPECVFCRRPRSYGTRWSALSHALDRTVFFFDRVITISTLRGRFHLLSVATWVPRSSVFSRPSREWDKHLAWFGYLRASCISGSRKFVGPVVTPNDLLDLRAMKPLKFGISVHFASPFPSEATTKTICGQLPATKMDIKSVIMPQSSDLNLYIGSCEWNRNVCLCLLLDVWTFRHRILENVLLRIITYNHALHVQLYIHIYSFILVWRVIYFCVYVNERASLIAPRICSSLSKRWHGFLGEVRRYLSQ